MARPTLALRARAAVRGGRRGAPARGGARARPRDRARRGDRALESRRRSDLPLSEAASLEWHSSSTLRRGGTLVQARRYGILALCIALLLGAAAPGRADTVLDGNTDGGAFFRIVVPTVWNGDLVIWNH